MYQILEVMNVIEMMLPELRLKMERVGENIKLARLRRRLSLAQVSQRSGISMASLSRIEKGNPSVSIGMYLQVLFVLGLENDITMLAEEDKFGRQLQDVELKMKKRAPKRRSHE